MSLSRILPRATRHSRWSPGVYAALPGLRPGPRAFPLSASPRSRRVPRTMPRLWRAELVPGPARATAPGKGHPAAQAHPRAPLLPPLSTYPPKVPRRAQWRLSEGSPGPSRHRCPRVLPHPVAPITPTVSGAPSVVFAPCASERHRLSYRDDSAPASPAFLPPSARSAGARTCTGLRASAVSPSWGPGVKGRAQRERGHGAQRSPGAPLDTGERGRRMRGRGRLT